MLDLILSLILVVMSGARMGEMVGSKVVVQNNLDGRLSAVTTYMASDRRRIEMRSSVQRLWVSLVISLFQPCKRFVLLAKSSGDNCGRTGCHEPVLTLLL